MPAIYQPLNPFEGEIRLLVVDTSQLDEQGRVICHLETVSLLTEPCPTYEAISWCWGDQTRRKHIIVNDQVTEVSENAAEVLRRVAFDKGHARVWIDAVCINQADIVERGQQVTMMREVYTKAERVLAWLGEDDRTTEAALKSIAALLEQCREETQDFEKLHECFYDGTHRRYSELPLPQCDWGAVSRFYSAPWFFRVWIVQEVFLAKTAICFRGTHSLPWPDISLAAQWMNHRNFWRFIGDDNPGIGIDKASRIWRFIHVKPHLTNLLSMNLYLQATEPLDKVYGILGLMESLGLDGAGIVPDYTADVGDVFARATRAAVESNGLSLLDCAQQLVPYDTQAAKTKDLDIPSWCPRYDWRDYRPGGSPAIPELPLRIGVCGDCHLELGSQSKDPKILTLKGLVVDHIAQVSNLFNEDLILNANKLSQEIMHLRALTRSLDHDDWSLAYTLTSNLTHGQGPAETAPNFLNQYRQFIFECRAKVNKTCTAEQLEDTSSLTYFSPTAWAFANTVWTHGRNRRVFVTEKGYVGTGYPGTEVEDVVCVVFGGTYPFVLRKVGEGWKMVGTAYVRGIMEGEYVRKVKEEGRFEAKRSWFDIR